VYAGLVFQRSPRFQQLWKTLWKKRVLSLQKAVLTVVELTVARQVEKGNQWTFRGSRPTSPVEKAPSPGYNDPVVLACAVPAYPKGPGLSTSPSAQPANPTAEGLAPAAAGQTRASEEGRGIADDQGRPAAGDPPRIAVYHEAQAPPLVVPTNLPVDGPPGESAIPRLVEVLTTRSYSLAREQGGIIPIGVFRELIENLVHASFAGVVITILDGGNTVRISDQGPGIPDKGAALRPGFTSAGAEAKEFIRGVGSGFSVVRETLAGLGGALEIEDNLGRGTVVTARVTPVPETSLASAPAPAYNLPERQLKILLLTVELAPVGPTRIAQELGVSTSTAYRDLVSLEQAGFVVCRPSGHRSATDAGLAYLNAVL
jgi:hypothetical protein